MAEENNNMDQVAVEDKVSDRIDDIVNRMGDLMKNFKKEYSALEKEIRDIRKDVIKIEKKSSKKTKKEFTGERKPSGITGQVKISEELRNFLKTEIFDNDELKDGLDDKKRAKYKDVFEGDIGKAISGGGEFTIPRVFVNGLLSAYISHHGLTAKNRDDVEGDGRTLVFDSDKGKVLWNLLSPKPEKDTTVTYFTIQRYLKGHYPKKVSKVEEVVDEEDEEAEAEVKDTPKNVGAAAAPTDKARAARRVRRVRKAVGDN